MRKLILIPTLLLGAFLVSGCGDDDEVSGAPKSDERGTFIQTMPDGREVPCVWVEGWEEVSISCDWSTP